MAQRGLGHGLGALFGDAALDDNIKEFEYLSITKIEPRQDQPRHQFSAEGLAELSESIREHGVIQPLTVRSIGDGYYQIIAGERRWRACRMVGVTEVPARIIDADDLKTAELAMVENLQREDLNPVEEAQGYKTLIEDYGMTQEQVAERVSKSRPVVANALRLLNLPESLLERLETGELSSGTARALLSLGDEARILEAAAAIKAQNMTVRDAEKLVKKLKKDKPDEKKKTGFIVDYTLDAEEKLSKALGRRVKIVDGKQKGRIELEFYGSDDFDALYTQLMKNKRVTSDT